MTNDSKELISAITASAAQLAATICAPNLGAAMAITSPLIQYTVSKCLCRYVKGDIDKFDNIDKAKLGFAYYAFCNYVDSMEKAHRELRGPSFLDNKAEYSKAEGFLMSLIDGIIKDKEAEKATTYGRVMGELFFSSDLKDQDIVHIVEPVFELTMDDIEVLCCFSPDCIAYFGALDTAVQSSHTMDDHILFHCLCHLLSLNLLVRVVPFSLTYRVENVRLSPIGALLREILFAIAPHTRLEPLFRCYNHQ